MVEFLPNNINTSGPRALRTTERRRRSETVDRTEFAPPPRPQVNFIPSPALLQELIEKALEALSRGIYWDRGSIINIVL